MFFETSFNLYACVFGTFNLLHVQSASHEEALKTKTQELALAEERATKAESALQGALVNNASAVRAAVESLQRQVLRSGATASGNSSSSSSSSSGSRHALPPSAGRETVLVAVATLMAVELRAALGLPSDESKAGAAAEHTSAGSTAKSRNAETSNLPSISSGMATGETSIVSASLRAAYRLFAATAQPLPVAGSASSAGGAVAAAGNTTTGAGGSVSGSVAGSGNAPLAWNADPAFPFSPLAGDLGDSMASLGLSSPGDLARKVRA